MCEGGSLGDEESFLRCWGVGCSEGGIEIVAGGGRRLIKTYWGVMEIFISLMSGWDLGNMFR